MLYYDPNYTSQRVNVAVCRITPSGPLLTQQAVTSPSQPPSPGRPSQGTCLQRALLRKALQQEKCRSCAWATSIARGISCSAAVAPSASRITLICGAPSLRSLQRLANAGSCRVTHVSQDLRCGAPPLRLLQKPASAASCRAANMI